MTEDTDFPRLTPRDDRLQGGGKLFRRPEELADEQFDLLAAAWADDALSGDSLAETEEALIASPERRTRADSFRQIRLVPLNDRWEGRNRMLKTDPGTYAIRRTLIATLTIAAALGALVILGPLKTRPDTKSAEPAVADAQPMSEALIAEASPVIRTLPAEGVTPATQNINQTATAASSSVDKTSGTRPAGVISGSGSDITSESLAVGVTARSTEGVGMPQTPGTIAVATEDVAKPEISLPQQNNITASVTSSSTDAVSDPGTIIVTADNREPAYSFAVNHNFAGAVPLLAAGPEASRLAPVELKTVTSLPVAERGDNWIVRGLSLLAEAITKEPKSVDGYLIADACVRGVNRVLGWEMELEQEKNHEGELLATNFSSSLLTFSAPAKKTQP